MSRSAAELAVPYTNTVGDYEEFDQAVALVCRGCGRKAKYQVGRIVVDPRRMPKKDDPKEKLEDAVSFSGLFRCRNCRAGGPWSIPNETRLQLLALIGMSSCFPEHAKIAFGISQMFDGTRTRCGAESEDYLKQKLQESPDDAFLWGRLGNLYDNAGEFALARTAYEKAVELDPSEVESSYTLGCYCMEDGNKAAAGKLLHRVVQFAHTAPRATRGILQPIVRDTIERLYELHCDSNAGGTFPPEVEGVELPSFDWGRIGEVDPDDLVDALATTYIKGKLPNAELKRFHRLMELDRATTPETITVSGSRRVGRNEPCPCGSGKKYKRCCG